MGNDDPGVADGGARNDGASLAPRGSALIVPIGGDNPEIGIMTLHDDGQVTDEGLRLPVAATATKSAISPDGLETAIIWSAGFGQQKGVTFVDLRGNPAFDAKVDSTLDFNISDDSKDYQQTATDLIYVSQDELLITVRGPDTDGAVPAFRTASGWELGGLIDLDDGSGLAGPRTVNGIPGTEDALVMTFPDPSKLYTLRRQSAGNWSQVGDFDQLDSSNFQIAMHPDGGFAYAVSEKLSGEGLIHIFEPGTDGAWEESRSPITISAYSSQISIAPNGEFAIVASPEGGGGTYRFITLDLGTPSAPSEVGNGTTVEGFLMRDFEIGPEGQMVISLDLPDQGNKIIYTMVQDNPGTWSNVWGPIVMPGLVEDIAVAEVSHIIN